MMMKRLSIAFIILGLVTFGFLIYISPLTISMRSFVRLFMQGNIFISASISILMLTPAFCIIIIGLFMLYLSHKQQGVLSFIPQEDRLCKIRLMPSASDIPPSNHTKLIHPKGTTVKRLRCGRFDRIRIRAPVWGESYKDKTVGRLEIGSIRINQSSDYVNVYIYFLLDACGNAYIFDNLITARSAIDETPEVYM